MVRLPSASKALLRAALTVSVASFPISFAGSGISLPGAIRSSATSKRPEMRSSAENPSTSNLSGPSGVVSFKKRLLSE